VSFSEAVPFDCPPFPAVEPLVPPGGVAGCVGGVLGCEGGGGGVVVSITAGYRVHWNVGGGAGVGVGVGVVTGGGGGVFTGGVEGVVSMTAG
jgi:hypothetical protein